MQWYNLARKLDNNGVDNPYFTDEEIAATYNGDPTDGFEIQTGPPTYIRLPLCTNTICL